MSGDGPRTFFCADGVTSMPWLAVGTQDAAMTAPNFVVIHDIFDTFEASQVGGVRAIRPVARVLPLCDT